MIDLLHLKTFVTIASGKSFNRAALELGYSQSSVTHHIKMLERELGGRLFDRFKFSQGATLTDFGRRTYAYASQILKLVDDATKGIR